MSACDLCGEDDHSWSCGKCGESESDEVPAFVVVIGSRADEAGAEPGLYQVTDWPWLISTWYCQRVIPGSLLRLGDAPEHIDGGERLCRECSAAAIVRRTRSRRWRVTTSTWDHHWQTKARIYRTKALALRRARAYIEARS